MPVVFFCNGVELGGRKYIKIGWRDLEFLSSYQFYQLICSRGKRRIALLFREKCLDRTVSSRYAIVSSESTVLGWSHSSHMNMFTLG